MRQKLMFELDGELHTIFLDSVTRMTSLKVLDREKDADAYGLVIYFGEGSPIMVTVPSTKKKIDSLLTSITAFAEICGCIDKNLILVLIK